MNKKIRHRNSTKSQRATGGTVYIWLTGLATAIGLLMIGLLLGLLFRNGLGIFWPAALTHFTMQDGSRAVGEIWDEETYRPGQEQPAIKRFRVKVANREIYGLDFRWIDETQIAEQRAAEDFFVIERRAWGHFIGELKALLLDGQIISSEPALLAELLPRYLNEASRIRGRIHEIESEQMGALNQEIARRQRQLQALAESPLPDTTTTSPLALALDALREDHRRLEARLDSMRAQNSRFQLMVATADGRTKQIALKDVIRYYNPNAMGMMAKAKLYLAHLWAFLSEDPREANTEGGVFPAIFGTVLMVILMSIAVVPLGVVTAVYMREYAKPGLLLNAIRITVNNLAGVPSIVYGIFGLGFFIYGIGSTLDSFFFADTLPAPTFGTGGILWASLTLALLTLPVVVVTTEEGLAAVPRSMREASLALGATKSETLWRVILPSASPSIFTGLILAISRAAGEVAPLMLTGVVKLAPSLPLDGEFPYLHLDRKFMHLGFHIFDVGFQSPNVEAALPMVYATTLLLILIVLILNSLAILLRNHLLARFSVSKF